MKKSFSTGLMIFLPIFLTFTIVSYLIDLLTFPFSASSCLSHPFTLFIAQLLILCAIFCLVVFLGYFAENLLLRFFINGTHRLFSKLPFINKIYHTSRQSIHTLFSSLNKSQLKPVYVPLGSSKQWVIGFTTGKSLILATSSEYVSVFVPETPNPTVGFMLLYPKETVQPSDLSTDEAMKLIFSCGASAKLP